jgi:hypothetical protein
LKRSSQRRVRIDMFRGANFSAHREFLQNFRFVDIMALTTCKKNKKTDRINEG